MRHFRKAEKRLGPATPVGPVGVLADVQRAQAGVDAARIVAERSDSWVGAPPVAAMRRERTGQASVARGNAGRSWFLRGFVLALAVGLLAGCGGTSSGSGASEVAISNENLEAVQGNLCAVKGHATNIGNLTVDVTIDYEARSATGVVIGTSSASFQIAPLSNFDFRNSKGNQNGQPSSGVFSSGLACAGISNFKRTHVEVTHA